MYKKNMFMSFGAFALNMLTLNVCWSANSTQEMNTNHNALKTQTVSSVAQESKMEDMLVGNEVKSNTAQCQPAVTEKSNLAPLAKSLSEIRIGMNEQETDIEIHNKSFSLQSLAALREFQMAHERGTAVLKCKGYVQFRLGFLGISSDESKKNCRFTNPIFLEDNSVVEFMVQNDCTISGSISNVHDNPRHGSERCAVVITLAPVDNESGSLILDPSYKFNIEISGSIRGDFHLIGKNIVNIDDPYFKTSSKV